MKTGLCPRCRIRYVAVGRHRKSTSTAPGESWFVVRAHDCGRGVRAERLQELSVHPTPKEITRAQVP